MGNHWAMIFYYIIIRLILNITFKALYIYITKTTKFGSQNFGYQIWFCTRLIRLKGYFCCLCLSVCPSVCLFVCDCRSISMTNNLRQFLDKFDDECCSSLNMHIQWNPSGKARKVSLKLQNSVHFQAQFFTNHVYFTPHDRQPLLKGHHLGWPLWRGSTVIDQKVHIDISWITEVIFYPRPVLASGYSHSLCLCHSVCINHLLVCTITRHLFKVGSLNLVQRSKTTGLRSLFWGAIDLDLQSQI